MDAGAKLWQLTVEDLRALEADLDEAGWDVLAVQAGHTSPLPPNEGDTDEFGFVIVLADNDADRIAERLVDGGLDAYERYEVFRRAAGDRMYVVVQYLAPDRDEAVLIAGSYRLRFLEPVREAASEAGELVTQFKRIDDTVVATFRHEAYEQFFPPAE
jgi:hypothetical protein